MSPQGHLSSVRPVYLHVPEPRAKAPDRSTSVWRVFKRGFLIALAMTLGFTVLSMENTAKFLMDVTASFVDGTSRQPSPHQPAQPSQSSLDSADVAIAADDRIVSQNVPPGIAVPGDVPEPNPEILFRQFQAWAVEQDAQRATPARAVQDSSTLAAAPARVVEDTVGSIGRAQSDRQVPRGPAVRPQAVRPDHRREIRQPQNARTQVAPATEHRTSLSKPSGS